jgi:hypothetical protein
MTVSEAIGRIRIAQQDLVANAANDCLLIASQIKALVAFRIQSRGYSFEEKPFSPYSKGHKKKRENQGYQTGYVDFTMTGKLWNNVQPYVIENTPDSTLVQVTALNREDQVKLQGAVNKRGNILELSESELSLLVQLNLQRVQKYLLKVAE